MDVFGRLARKLDRLPHGFPATESRVEQRILRKIFTAEDAELALRLRPLPQSAEAIARRARRPAGEVASHLDSMAARGQIGVAQGSGGRRYSLMPFVIGIYEFQLERIDEELAELFEEYAPALMGVLGGHKPALARVVPVNARIEATPAILPHDDLRELLSNARSFRVAPCICRKEKALQGQPCSHSLETCLAFSRQENAYDRFPPGGRVISREEALLVLQAAEDEGLVHCTYNVRQDPMFVCNCCSCCCGFLRGVREFKAPYVLAHSDFVARIDPESCDQCGACTGGRCPMDAIADEGTAYRVHLEHCIGCGLCAAACPSGAAQLVARPSGERNTPPATILDWAVERTSSRSPVEGLALRGVLALMRARKALGGRQGRS